MTNNFWFLKIVFANFLYYLLAVLRRIAPLEIRGELLIMGQEIRIYKNHLLALRTINSKLTNDSIVRLELGNCGRKMPGWIGVDIDDSADLQLDLRKPLPIPDKTVEAIYSSHVLEHFSYPEPLMGLLNECFRILKPGGSFSAALPDCWHYFSSYINGGQIIDQEIREKVLPVYVKTKIDEVSWFVYMLGHHKYLFDKENSVQLLLQAGFERVSTRDFDPAIDLEIRRKESLYLIAYKPI